MWATAPAATFAAIVGSGAAAAAIVGSGAANCWWVVDTNKSSEMFCLRSG